MRLQPTSRAEIRKITIGTLLFSIIMVCTLVLLTTKDNTPLDPGILSGAVGGSLVAIGNFALLCVSIQLAAACGSEKRRRAFLQGSYNGRLLLQSGWVLAAFLSPRIHTIAAALPLLFPSLSILCIQKLSRHIPENPNG